MGMSWKEAAQRLGEEIGDTGPDGYYDMPPDRWLAWAQVAVAANATALWDAKDRIERARNQLGEVLSRARELQHENDRLRMRLAEIERGGLP